MKEYEAPKVDATEKVLRLGYGGIFGVFFGLYVLRYFWVRDMNTALIGAAITAVLFALLALKFGDRFWGWLGRLWR